MSLTVSFSFDSEEEKAAFEKYAKEKGMRLSALAKMATYQYKAKYPHRGEKNGEVGEEIGGASVGQNTVQPERLEGNQNYGTTL